MSGREEVLYKRQVENVGEWFFPFKLFTDYYTKRILLLPHSEKQLLSNLYIPDITFFSRSDSKTR